jgi:hypothetical protein
MLVANFSPTLQATLFILANQAGSPMNIVALFNHTRTLAGGNKKQPHTGVIVCL